MNSEYWVSVEGRSVTLGSQDLQFDSRCVAIARALRLVFAVEANGEVWLDSPDPTD